MSFHLFYVSWCWSITDKTRQFNLRWVVVAFNVNRTLLKSAHFLNKIMQVLFYICWFALTTKKSDYKRNHLKRLAQPTKNWPKLSRRRLTVYTEANHQSSFAVREQEEDQPYCHCSGTESPAVPLILKDSWQCQNENKHHPQIENKHHLQTALTECFRQCSGIFRQ